MRNIKHIKNVSNKPSSASTSKLITPTDLGDKARTAITKALNPLIADVFSLYIKTKNFHWHVSGSHYRDYHLLFDEQADQVFEMTDVLAERVRKLGGTTIRSVGQIQELSCINDDNDDFVDAKDMIRRLMDDNKRVLSNMRHAHKVCSDHQDVATTSVLEVFIDETERRIWFLFETQAQ